MRTLLTALLASTALAACTPPTSTNGETAPAASPAVTVADAETTTAALNDWFEAKYEEQVARSPLTQTSLGRKPITTR